MKTYSQPYRLSVRRTLTPADRVLIVGDAAGFITLLPRTSARHRKGMHADERRASRIDQDKGSGYFICALAVVSHSARVFDQLPCCSSWFW